jgi:UDP-N-acetylmuramoyl-L-alanyl-D-glutamate--2,6-diaminopimelate ligase
MKVLNISELLKGIDYEIVRGNPEIEVTNVQYDSRKINKGDIFVAIEGFSTDGHNFINNAVAKGAAAIIVQKHVDNISGCVVIKVEDTRKALAIAASNFNGKPSKKMKLIGITGTNGKTTSTYMIKAILEAAGYKVGLIGTIANFIGEKKVPAHRTTPESLELHEMFKTMIDNGVQYCIMEVSSHSLALNRVYGINYSSAIFTNLTQDHLDFHKTFEEYFNAKAILFKNTLCSVINSDDEYGRRLMGFASGKKLTYAVEADCDIKAENIVMHSRGTDFDIKYKNKLEKINLMLPGKYNVYNALCAAAVCINEGIGMEHVKRGLSEINVPGRCEIVTKNYNLGFEVIVDYAHSPDGLYNVLNTVREFTKGRLISVFGCGGDRDKTKRPIMGKIASELSDIAVVTSDNPRSEEPDVIIDDIIEGVKKDNYIVIENRRNAIKNAIEIAKPGDVIVVAGKGHEDYQEIKGQTFHFDEREIIKEIIESRN